MALAGAFNTSGSQSRDCVQLVPRSGKGQASKQRASRRSRKDSVPVEASNQRNGLPGAAVAAKVAACSKGIRTSVDLKELAARPDGSS